MALSTERVLLAWVEDLEQGLEELERSRRRRQHQDDLHKDLMQSAHGLLALSQVELRKLSGNDIALLDNDAGTIRTLDDVRQLCIRLRRVFRVDADEPGGASSD